MKKTMKKGIAYALTLAMLIGNSMFVAKAADANFAGEGTATSPFEISTSADLVKLEQLSLDSSTAATYADKHFILTNDIDMSGIAFTGLFRAKEFVGTFDGDGHVIENLTVNRSDNAAAYAGLFACAEGGVTIKNLGVVNATMTSGSSKCAGGIIGVIYGRISTPITIENCFVRGVSFSSGNNTSGGLVGHIYEGKIANITNCYTTDLKGSSASGGVSGNVSGGTHAAPILTNVYSTNNIGSGTNVLGNIGEAAANTIEGFIAASNGAFVEGTSDKNGGYPLLAWENASSEQPSGPFSGGEGTEQNPFKISTADDLIELNELTLSTGAAEYIDKHFILTADIDMTSIAFTGLFRGKEFVGTFDGNGYVIENLTVNRSDNAAAFAGLFACAKGGATIKNLGLVEANMTSGSDRCAGGLIGVIYTGISAPINIENCFVRGISFNNSGNNTCGGLIGHIYSGLTVNITNCYTTDLKGGSPSGAVSGEVVNLGAGSTPILTNVYSTNNIGSTGTNVLGNIDEAAANTIEGFITASNGAFVEGTSDKNGGYPLLAWEVGFVSLSFEDGKVVVNNDTKELLEGVIIIAAYDNTECMLDVCVMDTDLSVAAKSELEVPYDTVSGATKYKAFIWNSMSDMTPICVPAVN